MDPNNQPPQPNQPPPQWGAPPPGAAPAGPPPQWGAPPPGTAPAGPPPQWGAPPPGAAPAGPPPQWGVAPAAPARRRIPRPLIVAGVVLLLVVVGAVIGVLTFGNPDAGKVVFTTDQPTATEANTCEVGTRVTTVKVGTPVYVIYFLRHRLAATDTVNLEVIRDGTSISSDTVPSAQTSDADCIESFQDISSSLDQPGKYEIKMTAGGETVADGTLTITP